MIFNMIGLVIGIMILGAGIYYLLKEKNDSESKKIYSITTGIGAGIVLAVIVKICFLIRNNKSQPEHHGWLICGE